MTIGNLHASGVAAVGLVAVAGSALYGAWSPPAWSIEQIGLFSSPEFTAPGGDHISKLDHFSDEGYAAGYSGRQTDGYGFATWAWREGHDTVRTGLYADPEFVRADGYQFSDNVAMSDTGVSIGYSNRYLRSASQNGQATWVFDHATGVSRTGLYDSSEFISPTGRQQSWYYETFRITDSGRVVGTSDRYNAGGDTRGYAAWTWGPSTGNHRVGLIGPEYTAPDGSQRSDVAMATNSDHVFGTSERYIVNVNSVAWAWSPDIDNTIQIGLTAGNFTSTNGRQRSNIIAATEDGRAFGNSYFYPNGTNERGQALWTWDQTSGTTRIGLFDGPAFTAASGAQQSELRGFNQSGRALGSSTLYKSGTSIINGEAAWVWAPESGTIRLGFFDAEFTGTEGQQTSRTLAHSASRIAGYSLRLPGPLTAQGIATWTWTPESGTERIGLYQTPEFIGSNGVSVSYLEGMSQSDQIIGYSYRYDAASLSLGRVAWSWTPGAGTQRIGLDEGAPYERTDGYVESIPRMLNENGLVVGRTVLHSGMSQAGLAAWAWNAENGTSRIGLFDTPEFTSASGMQRTDAEGVTESGHVYGSSVQYLGNPNQVSSVAWVWSQENANQRVGVFDARHTGPGGMSLSVITKFTQSGFFVGTSRRYGSDNLIYGDSGWLYSPLTNETYPLIFSESANGRANTTITLLTDSGWVLGTFDDYSSPSFAYTAFIWSVENGFSDLGSLVDGQLSDYGWQLLSRTLGITELQTILGEGAGPGIASSRLFAMSVPSPCGMLLLVPLMSCMLRRHRSEPRTVFH